jgi:ArsR family transcriptional regulator
LNSNLNDSALVFKALSDPNRLMIIRMLRDEEMCACKLLEEFNITQPTLSHHMKILCEAGLVNCRREGKWMHYFLNKKEFKAVKDILDEISSCEK